MAETHVRVEILLSNGQILDAIELDLLSRASDEDHKRLRLVDHQVNNINKVHTNNTTIGELFQSDEKLPIHRVKPGPAGTWMLPVQIIKVLAKLRWITNRVNYYHSKLIKEIRVYASDVSGNQEDSDDE